MNKPDPNDPRLEAGRKASRERMKLRIRAHRAKKEKAGASVGVQKS